METEKTAWHSQSVAAVAGALGTNLEAGLSEAEAKARLDRYGTNELIERPHPGFWQLLIGQFKDFLILILIASAVVSLALGDVKEAIAIMAIVILNAVVGVVQESKAEEALAALKKMAAPEAQVIRGGHRLTVPARELVPGDLVLLEAGNYIPADMRLVESVNLNIDEASLTGESVPVRKSAVQTLAEDVPLGDRINSAFMSTTATYGRGKGIVIATGMQTQIGLIAEMIQSYEEESTPLQERLGQLGRWLGWGSLALCAIVFIAAVIQDWPNLGWDVLQEEFIIAVSLAIAAVPEGLPAVVTICLAMGMREMARRHALIRRLAAVETLGSATVICSDKTGTLTQNEMMAVRLYVAQLRLDVSGQGYQPKGEFDHYGEPFEPQDNSEVMALLTGSLLCSDAILEPIEEEYDEGYRMVGDPTEGAMVVAAAKANLWRREVEARLPRVAEVPFDSDRKRMSTIHRIQGEVPVQDGTEYIAFVKGAPDVMLGLCDTILEAGENVPLTPGRRQHIENIIRDLGQDGLRVLAVAYRHLEQVPEQPAAEEIERNLNLIGLVAMTDPARPEVKTAIQMARQAGIRTVMITGDYPDTARAIAEDIDLVQPGGEVITGAQLNEMSDEELAGRIENVDVFARVSPQHKVRIVEALKAQDHIAAMTGDGVNDAPALKRASIGVAMGITGTDVSKETADMVLTDDNYASIVSAIEQGRIIYSNIRKFVYYLLSCNMAEIMTIFLATVFGSDQPPLNAIQLLWLNLLTDGAPALALGMEKGDPDLMTRPPRPAKEPIINRFMVSGIVVQTLAITAIVLAAYYIPLTRGWTVTRGDQVWSTVQVAQTMAFIALSASELVRAYTARSERASVFKLGVFSNKYMQYAVLVSITLLMGAVYIPGFRDLFNAAPLTWREWELLVPLLLIPSIAAEATKAVARWRDRRAGIVAA